MNMTGVSGGMFLKVPAHPGSPRQTAAKRLQQQEQQVLYCL